MARTADPALAERNAKIIADAKANPFQSDADLGRNYGVSPGLVYLIRKDAGLTNRERPKGRMKKEDRRALSPLHTLIGAKVHRTFHNQILETPGQPGIKEGDLAKILLLTPQRLAGVQLGIIDLTLTEIQRICAWLKVPIEDIISECVKDSKLYQPRKLSNTGS